MCWFFFQWKLVGGESRKLGPSGILVFFFLEQLFYSGKRYLGTASMWYSGLDRWKFGMDLSF